MNNKKIVSLLLSAALTTSVAPAVSAYEAKTSSIPMGYVDEMASRAYYMEGVYTTIVNGQPIHVYLGNNVENRYLPKQEALYASELVNERTYVFSKTVNNPNYIRGISPISERTITIYAISGKSYVSGWSKVDKNTINPNTYIATTIELGEFLLKGEDLSRYYYDMRGFAYADFDKDGKSTDLIYLGNEKINQLFDSKEEAIRYAVDHYDTYYILRKTVTNPNYVRGINEREKVVYALSEKSYASGWTKVEKRNVPSDVKIGSNVEYMEAIFLISFQTLTEDKVVIPSAPLEPALPVTPVVPVQPVTPVVPVNPIVANRLVKHDALTYAYCNYSNFCILTKTINYNGTSEVLYAFSFTPEVEGWTIVANDDIPAMAHIFFTMDDAFSYEYQMMNNYTMTLK